MTDNNNLKKSNKQWIVKQQEQHRLSKEYIWGMIVIGTCIIILVWLLLINS